MDERIQVPSGFFVQPTSIVNEQAGNEINVARLLKDTLQTFDEEQKKRCFHFALR